VHALSDHVTYFWFKNALKEIQFTPQESFEVNMDLGKVVFLVTDYLENKLPFYLKNSPCIPVYLRLSFVQFTLPPPQSVMRKYSLFPI